MGTQHQTETPPIPDFTPGTLAAVQADDWFYGPDGQQYRVAFGPVTIIRAKDALGIEPKNSANWFAKVGEGSRAILIAGCRIHFVTAINGPCPQGKDIYDASRPALDFLFTDDQGDTP